MNLSYFLKLENRSLNFWLIAGFILTGVIAEMILKVHSFVYVFLILSLLFPENRRGKFTDKLELVEYNSGYTSSLYRAFMSLAFVFLAMYFSPKITLDIAFFIIWSVGYSILGYTDTFIPVDGFNRGGDYVKAQLYLVFFLSVNLALLYFIISNFSGFNWFSSVITEPLTVLY